MKGSIQGVNCLNDRVMSVYRARGGALLIAQTNFLANTSVQIQCRAIWMQINCQYFLVFAADGTCPSCSAETDRMGDHALGCQKYQERIARHDQLRDVLGY